MSATATDCAVLGKMLEISVSELPASPVNMCLLPSCGTCAVLWAVVRGSEQVQVKDHELLDSLTPTPQCLCV